MSSYPQIDNKGKDILILGKGLTQDLVSIHQPQKNCIQLNLLKKIQNFVQACVAMEKIFIYLFDLFVNGTKIIKFKAKDLEITAYSLCLGNISKDWSVDI